MEWTRAPETTRSPSPPVFLDQVSGWLCSLSSLLLVRGASLQVVTWPHSLWVVIEEPSMPLMSGCFQLVQEARGDVPNRSCKPC